MPTPEIDKTIPAGQRSWAVTWPEYRPADITPPELRPSALAYYDVDQKKWKAEAGEYEIRVGNSSRDADMLTAKVNQSDDQLISHY